jgi:hypothetical protein
MGEGLEQLANFQSEQLMVSELFELHYYLRDGSHAMDALVRNKCETEALAAFLEIAAQLGITVQLETTAYTEGGLKEIWRFLGESNNQLSLLLAIIVLIFSRVPISDPELDSLNKEIARLTIEEKKLNIEKLKREIKQGRVTQESIDAATSALESNFKIATRRSNFYRGLLGYEKVTSVGFSVIPESKSELPIEHTVQRAEFGKFVLLTDKLPIEVVDGAKIEIVAPVLREGSYQWKGIYQSQPISFAMLDEAFKTSVLRREVSFQRGSTIECVLNIHRKFNEVGDISITGYSVSTVLTKSDGVTVQETPQGKRHRHQKKLEASQGQLFDFS